MTEAGDAIDVATEQWASTWPTLDASPGEVLARIQRLGQLIEDRQNQRLRRRPGLPIRNLGDFDVLRALRRSGSPFALTPGEIARAMLVSAAGLTGRIHRLQSDGWITREPSSSDGRSTLVKLTEEGLRDLDAGLPEHYAFESGLLHALDEQKREQLALLLRQLTVELEP